MSMNEIMQWVSFFRDLGLILGIPVLIGIGVKLYNQQIEILKARNELLKETQYDRAVTLLKSQKEVYVLERSDLENQVGKLGTLLTEKDAQLSEVKEGVNRIQELIRKMSANSIELNETTLEALLQQVRNQGPPTVSS